MEQPMPMEAMKEQPTVDIEKLQASCDEYLAGWKRAQADYANLKRAAELEKQDSVKYANERLLASLLPALDQYDTAMQHVPDLAGLADADKKRFENWIAGMNAVRSSWRSALSSVGAEMVGTTGAFDPSKHEAVGEEVSAEVGEGEIVRTVESGWSLNGRLIRPARVVLSKGND